MNSKAEFDVIVLGAGIVGICTAWSLRRRGFQVLLLDKSPPASETSHGNSGVICSSGIHPLASPGLLGEIPSLALNRDTRFLMQYSELPWLAPWLLHFLGNCSAAAFNRNTRGVGAIAADSVARHRELMQRAGAMHLLNDTGWLNLYRNEAGFKATLKHCTDYDEFGIPWQQVDSAQIAELEPDLGVPYAAGIWLTGTPSVINPGALAEHYFEQYLKEGGQFRQQAVTAIERKNSGWQVVFEGASASCQTVVLAMGAWSNDILKPLGIKLPFVQERGYHMMFAAPEGKRLTRSIQDSQLGYVLTPMEHGIRVTTGCNLVARERAPNPKQLARLMPDVRQTFAVGEPILEKPWMGRRISTPDSLPLIGPIQGQPGLLAATGHCHLGLTLGPITGELIADELSGKPDPRTRLFNPLRL